MDRKESAMRTALLAISAGVLGATLALLYAPQSGQKTRKDIKRLTGNLANRAKDLEEDIRARVETLVEECEGLAGKKAEEGKELIDSAISALNSSKELISRQIRRIQESLQS